MSNGTPIERARHLLFGRMARVAPWRDRAPRRASPMLVRTNGNRMLTMAGVVLVAIVVAFTSTATYLSFLIFERQNALARVSHYNLQWNASQAVNELARLGQAIAMTAVPGADVDPEETKLRYDIFVSRLAGLHSGEFERFMASNVEHRRHVAAAEAVIAEVGPTIGDSTKAAAVLDRLVPLTADFLSLAAAANRFGGEQVAQDQADLLSLHWWFSAMVVGLIGFGFGLITLLAVSNGLLRNAHARLARATEALRETMVSRALLNAAIENMSQGLCMFDDEQRLVMSNPKFEEVIGLPPGCARPPIGLGELILRAEGQGAVDAPRLLRAHALRVGGAAAAFETEAVSGERIVSIVHRPLPEGGWLATFEDVSERKRNEARIAHLARHDVLTGLPNRLDFNEEIQSTLVRARLDRDSVAVLCLDLDHFKSVNDTLGHPVGDALLRAVADRLRSCVRSSDTPARLGGDEFAVIQVAGEQPRAAAALARRLVQELGQPYQIDHHRIVIGVSIGITVATPEELDASVLLKKADLALYEAKAVGRGGFRFFEPQLEWRARERRALETDLHKALAENEFRLAFQPVIDFSSGRIVAFEALLRWPHPTRGLVPPTSFIGIAEELGLADALGEWVLRAACRTAAGWPVDIKVAVNVSPEQFKTDRLIPAVVRAYSEAGLGPSRLELEITESVLLRDTPATQATLRELRALGISIALDDFGTGYSSLGYLKHYTFDKIKIDQTFVRDMENSPQSKAILRAVTALGRSLGMTTTAEGIETREQFELVRAEGCDQGQGYLIGRPIPAEEVPILFEKERRALGVAA